LNVFEGGLEGMGEALISVLVLWKLQSLVGSSSEFDPYRSKVAEEMLCEVIVQIGYAERPLRLCFEGCRAAGLRKLLSLARQLPTNFFDIRLYLG
jgi:hypothetical protein